MVAVSHVDVLPVAFDPSDAAVKLLVELSKYDPTVLSCVSHADVGSVFCVDPNSHSRPFS